MAANFGNPSINLHHAIKEARISTNLTSGSITEPRELHYITFFFYLVCNFFFFLLGLRLPLKKKKKKKNGSLKAEYLHFLNNSSFYIKFKNPEDKNWSRSITEPRELFYYITYYIHWRVVWGQDQGWGGGGDLGGGGLI